MIDKKNSQELMRASFLAKLNKMLFPDVKDPGINMQLDKYDASIDLTNRKVIEIKGASQYTCVDDLWVLTSYYNPSNYKTKRENFEIFIESLKRSNLKYTVIECVFGNDNFMLAPGDNVLQVRAKDIMWQKERLLNHAVRSLPPQCKKVAWVDCDVLFDNKDWALDTSLQLEKYKVIQPFEFAVRLPQHAMHFYGEGDWYTGFAFIYKNYPNILTTGDFSLHGHTGFAWAARREIIEKYGLYDACIGGSGDHMMAHAFCGDWDTACVNRIIGLNNAYYFHYLKWCKAIYKEVRGSVSYIPGTLLHLWHGDLKHRKYTERERSLEDYKYDPGKDLIIANSGAWEWKTAKKDLIAFTNSYFSERKEDG